MKPLAQSNAQTKRYITSIDLMGTDDSPAQTASVSDNDMLTYIKLPIPSPMDGNAATSNADSDDARFLDGLFERSSGSSDNGSDKGSDSGINLNGHEVAGASNIDGKALTDGSTRSGAVSATGGMCAPNATSAYNPTMTAQLAPSAQAPVDSNSMSNSTCQPNISHALPQHLMYRTNNSGAFLPPNLLGQEELPPRQVDPNLGALNSNNLAQNSMQHLNNWVVAAPAPAQAPVPVQAVSSSGFNPNTAQFGTNVQQLRQGQLTGIQNQIQQQIQAPQHQAYAETVLSSKSLRTMAPPQSSQPPNTQRKRRRSSNTSGSLNIAPSISEDEVEMEKRRNDRNRREQERSQRISKQISELKGLLAAANVTFKPDKYSTLVSVRSFIKSLQQKSALLDEEQRKLVQTLAKSNELVNKSQNGVNAGLDGNQRESLAQKTASGLTIIPANRRKAGEEEILAFVRGLDYKNIFCRIRIALCVTSIDGQLIDCNDEFVRTCGLARSVLVGAGLRKPTNGDKNEEETAGKSPLSLFYLMAREDMQKVFTAMSAMLKSVHKSSAVHEGSAVDIETGTGVGNASDFESDHWSSQIRHFHHSSHKLQLNVSLVRHEKRTPRFFNCALTKVKE